MTINICQYKNSFQICLQCCSIQSHLFRDWYSTNCDHHNGGNGVYSISFQNYFCDIIMNNTAIKDYKIAFIKKRLICFMYNSTWWFIWFVYCITENLTPFGKATQSTSYGRGYAINAVNPPISNEFKTPRSTWLCSHTNLTDNKAWWMFAFSFGTAYITDITIYYRKYCKYTQAFINYDIQ